MYHLFSWRQPVRSSKETRLAGLIFATLVVAGCQSFLEPPTPSPETSETSPAPQPGVASPTWRRWPSNKSGQSASPPDTARQPSELAAAHSETNSSSAETSPASGSSQASAVSLASALSPDTPLPTQANHEKPATDAKVSPTPGPALDDRWYLLWEVGDQQSSDPTYRWRNDRLTEMTSAADDASALLRLALDGEESSAAATAAIGLARQGDDSLHERMVEITRNHKHSLPMRRAAIETLAFAESSAARGHIKDLLRQYGHVSHGAQSSYVSELHAELIRAWARHASVSDDPAFVDALSSPAEVVLVETLQAWATSHAETLPDEIAALIGHDRPNVRLAALQAVAGCQYEPALPQVLAAGRDHELKVRLEATRTLGAIDNDQARVALAEILKREAEHPRIAAVTALAQAGDMTAVYAAAADRSWRVRLAVATALAQEPSLRGREVARSLLEDSSVAVASRVVVSLLDWPLDAAVPLLLQAAEMPAVRLRKDAAAQLADRWDPALTLGKPLTEEQRHELIASLRQRAATEFGNVAQAEPQLGLDDRASVGNEHGNVEVTHQRFVRVETMLLEYLDAATDEEQSRLRADLTDNPTELVAVCEDLVFDMQRPLDDRIYGQLLATVDSHWATIEQVGSSDVDQRRVAAEKLVTQSAKQALSKLALHRLAMLVTTEADIEVWRSVLDVLGGYDGEPARRLAHAAASHLSPDIRRRACEYMGLRDSAEHSEILLSLLGDGDTSVVRAAVRAVGSCGPLSEIAPLKQLLSSPDNTLRVEAAIALARVGSASGPAALDRLSYDADETVRQRVAAALGQLGDSANTPTLIRLLDDRPAVRRAALEALPKVVQSPFSDETTTAGPTTPEKLAELWKDWYRQQGSGVLIR